MGSPDIAFMAQPSYKFCITYGISPSTTHTASYFLGTGAGVNLIYSLTIPPSWTNQIKRQNLPQLQAAPKELLPLDELILLHLRLGALSAHIWFKIALYLAVATSLSSLSTDRFTRGTFLLERIVASWRSQSVALLAHKQTLQDTRISNAVSHNSAPGADRNVSYDSDYDVVRVAKRVVLQPHKQHHILFTAK